MKKLVCIVILWLIPTLSWSYEIHTNARITEKAHLRSNLNFDATLTDILGLRRYRNSTPPYNTNPNLGKTYYDLSGATIYARQQKNFSVDGNRMPEISDTFSIQGWLMRGVIREDDKGYLPFPLSFIPFGDTPHDDPFRDIFRSFNHFLDPANNDRPLTIAGIEFGDENAANWALGVLDFRSSALTENPVRRNHFTIFDANEAMWRALTATDSGVSASKFIVPNGDGSGGTRTPIDEAEEITVRKAYWATTFRALGDVVHLLQDMAQPQHTRNDQHLFNNEGLDNTVYELYTNMRALLDKKLKFECFDGALIGDTLPGVVYGAYPIPEFTYSDYFSSATKTGMADYSNRGFLTAGTNHLMNTEYPDPRLESLTREAVNFVDPCLPTSGAEVITQLLVGAVLDSNVPGYIDTRSDGSVYDPTRIPLSAFGALFDDPDDPDTPYLTTEGYTLTQQNYDAMADLLIPRAVAYSTGLLNYFFRGRLEISAPDDHVYAIADHSIVDQNGATNFKTVKLKVRNISPDIGGQAQLMENGELVAVARFLRNSCFQTDLSGEYGADNYPGLEVCRTTDLARKETAVSAHITIDTIQSISQNSPVEFTFDFSNDPIPVGATDLTIQVVYKGDVGQEYGIAVGHKDIFEPHFLAVINNSDYVGMNGRYVAVQDIYDTSVDTVLLDEAYVGLGGFLTGTTSTATKLAYVSARINPIAQNYAFTFGAGTTPVATMASLPPGQFGRIAFLQDGSPFTMKVSYDERVGLNINQITKTFTLGRRINIWNPAINNFSFGVVWSLRGIYTISVLLPSVPIGTGVPTNDFSSLTGTNTPVASFTPWPVSTAF